MLGWFKDWIGYPAGGCRLPRQRRLGREPDRARLRARGARRRRCATTSSSTSPTRRTPRSPARRALLGFRAEQVRVLPVGDALPPRAADARGGDGCGHRSGTPARSSSAASGGATNTGVGRPARRARRRSVAERGALVARRRGVRRLRRAHRTRPARARRASSAPTPSRSTRTSGSTSRTSAVACSCVTDERLRATFEIIPDYLRDAEAVDAEVNFSDLGLQLSRTARAFKLWFSLRYFGIDAFADGDRHVARRRRARSASGSSRARRSSTALRRRSAIVCFRRRRRHGRRDGDRAAQRTARGGSRVERHRSRLLDAFARTVCVAALRPEPHDPARARRRRARADRDRRCRVVTDAADSSATAIHPSPTLRSRRRRSSWTQRGAFRSSRADEAELTRVVSSARLMRSGRVPRSSNAGLRRRSSSWCSRARWRPARRTSCSTRARAGRVLR